MTTLRLHRVRWTAWLALLVAGGAQGWYFRHEVSPDGGAYLGNEIEKNTKRSSAYQIKVRMNDGSVRTLTQRDAPDVRLGDRVKMANGAIVQVL